MMVYNACAECVTILVIFSDFRLAFPVIVFFDSNYDAIPRVIGNVMNIQVLHILGKLIANAILLKILAFFVF